MSGAKRQYFGLVDTPCEVPSKAMMELWSFKTTMLEPSLLQVSTRHAAGTELQNTWENSVEWSRSKD